MHAKNVYPGVSPLPHRRTLILTVLLAAAIVGCAPVQGSNAPLEALPTLIPSPLPENYSLNMAEDIARRYMAAWAAGDYTTMHSLTTFAARDKTPLSDFTELYEAVTADMTLLDLDYTIATLQREQPSVAVLSYNVTFQTRIVGQFTDANRQMRLTIDPVDADWRVAWTPGDIFNEMAVGGALRLERSTPRRANIYDRNGEVLADQNGRMVTINLVRANIPNEAACIGSLANALGETPEAVVETLANNGVDWLAEIGVIEPAVYLEYEDRLVRECAAEFGSFNTRRYPQGTLMPHVVGYVGYPEEAELEALRAAGFNQDAIIGRTGIEQSWDETLRGEPGGRLSIVNGNNVVRIITEYQPRPAQSVWLTIDTRLQAYAQGVITQTYRDYADSWAPRSKGAVVVVLDPNTGAVLAMVSYPTYDANAFLPFPTIGRAAADAVVETVQRNPRTPQLNRVTQGNYTSGSVMKIATTLAVVDSGVYTPETTFVCSGTWSRENGFVRTDWLPGGHGFLSVRTALAQSCNPFYYEAGYQADASDPYLLPTYFNRFGLGAPSGITDLEENPGLIAGPDYVRNNYGLNWSFSRSVNMAIGQDIDITPLQIARMTAIIANGGTLYKPQVVGRAGIIGEAPTYEMQPEALTELNLSDEAIQVVREGMCDVTREQYGTAEYQFRNQRVQQFSPCGKTGTAQSPGEDTLPHAWFTAYAPADNPEVVVTVMVENAGEGSAIAAPIARDILDYYFFEMPDAPPLVMP
jgi:penicillin-binding protein 2